MKKSISFICMAALVLSMVLSVSAADYGEAPLYELPQSGVGIAIAESATGATAGTVSTISKTAVAAGDVVKVPATMTLKASAIKTLARIKDGVLKLDTNKLGIEIKASDVKKAKSFPLTFSVRNTATSIVLSSKYTDEFGLKMSVTIKDTKMPAEVLKKAHVYCDGVDLGPVTVDANGDAVITMEKGGQYIISLNAPTA